MVSSSLSRSDKWREECWQLESSENTLSQSGWRSGIWISGREEISPIKEKSRMDVLGPDYGNP